MIITLYLSIILILSLISCSPQRKLNRLLKKHPELLQIDTIKIQDSIFIPEVKVDTVFHHSILKDTVIITKEKLKIKILEVNDTVFLDASVKSDTVIITKEIPVEKLVYVEPVKWYVWFWKGFVLWWGLLVVGFGFGVWFLRR